MKVMPTKHKIQTRNKVILALVSVICFTVLVSSVFSLSSLEIEDSSLLGNVEIIDDVEASNGQAVNFIGSAQTQRFPVAIDPTSRYFLDQYGDPWLGVGDTAWSLIGQLNDADIALYLDNRAAKGVNYVLLSAPEPYYNDTGQFNIDGEYPFTGYAFQTPLNEAYWQRVDYAIDYAASLGITFLICPMYNGWNNDGWQTELLNSTNADMTQYATYLADRYKDRQNIMWLLGHDRLNLSDTIKSRGKAIADVLQTQTPHLLTAASNRSRDNNTFGIGTEEWAGSGIDLDFDTQYDYSGAPGKNATVMWDLNPAKPFIFLEGVYEQEQGLGGINQLPIGDKLLRHQLWAPFVDGAAATIFGNNPIWGLGTNRLYTSYQGTWQENMDYPGSQYLAKFAEITSSLGNDWATTIQDSSSTFVTNQGTERNKVSARFNTSTGLIYHPNFTNGSLNIDLTELSAGATASINRYDPVSGEITNEGNYPTNSDVNISAPPQNSAGESDWFYYVSVN